MTDEGWTHLLEGVLDAVPTAILVVDERGTIVRANQHVTPVFGYDRDELVGMQVDALVPGEQRTAHEPLRAAFMASPAVRMMGHGREVEAVRKDGSHFRVEVGLAAVQSGDQRLVVAAAHDITVRLALELQLHEAQKMEALGRLAGGIAHDFNNLLTAINGYADLVALELPEGSPIREEVDQIRAAGDRGAALIRQLLAFGRRSPLRPQQLALGEVLHGLRPLLQRLVSEAVEVRIEVAADTPPVLADRGQLEQAVVNLVANARDAMPGGGTVRIEALGAAGGGAGTGTAPREAVIVVRDTGIGIDEAIRPHLFTPFFTTKAAGKGTGLGLASVHGFVTQSGGRVDVESEPGGGAVFTIRLPATDQTPGATESAGRTIGARGRGELVLLVEDDQTVRALARTVLERQGYRVLALDRPLLVDAALAEAGETPAVLVTDVVMPGMDGRTLARMLRRRDPSLAVVLMSGYAPGLDGPGGVGEPLDGLEGAVFVPKPFDPNDLAVAVRTAIEQVLA